MRAVRCHAVLVVTVRSCGLRLHGRPQGERKGEHIRHLRAGLGFLYYIPWRS